MILVDKDIINYINKYNLIENYSIECIQPASYDLRISNKLLQYDEKILLKGKSYNYKIYEYDKAILLPSSCNDIELKKYQEEYPEHLVIRTPVLSSTIEKINIHPSLGAFYTGRSSWGRKFMVSHKTAGYCDPGWGGTITLEITVDIPVEIHAGDRIGQIIFYKTTKKPEIDYSKKIDAKYNNQIDPTPSKTIVDDKLNVIYVDGTVNKNPGTFGIAGVLHNNLYYCYTYERNVTNNMMEALAILHALDFVDINKRNVIYSDSQLTVKAINGDVMIKKEPYASIIQKVNVKIDELDCDIEILHRKGHTCYDFIGNKISNIIKMYNKNIDIYNNVSDDTTIILGDKL